MTLLQALGYFLEEAGKNLWRGWKATLLAVATIALSLFVGGFFLLTTGNLESRIEAWRSEFKIVVYLIPEIEASEIPEELLAAVGRPGWVEAVELVDAEAALERFRQGFPSLGDALVDENPFHASIEARLAETAPTSELDAWAQALEDRPEVDLVDDDREWLDQLGRVLGVVRWMGLAIGLGLLVAAAFTIASVVRLSALLHLEEISVLRLVGATEFFIRGPFYMEGLLQGLIGGALAVSTLFVAELGLRAQAGGSVWGELLFSRFLGVAELGLLLVVGAIAGLTGAMLSLRRERLEPPEDS